MKGKVNYWICYGLWCAGGYHVNCNRLVLDDSKFCFFDTFFDEFALSVIKIMGKKMSNKINISRKRKSLAEVIKKVNDVIETPFQFFLKPMVKKFNEGIKLIFWKLIVSTLEQGWATIFVRGPNFVVFRVSRARF